MRQRGRERERESEGRGSSWANGVAKKPPKTEGNDEDGDDEEDEEDNEEAGALDNVMLIVPAIVVVVALTIVVVVLAIVVVVVAAMGAHSPMRHILIANNCRRQRSCFSVTCRTARRCPALPSPLPPFLPRRLPLASVQIYDILLSAIVAAIYAPLLPCSFSSKGAGAVAGQSAGQGNCSQGTQWNTLL